MAILKEIEKNQIKPKISVGMSTCGLAAGAQAVYDELEGQLKKLPLEVELTKTGCIGMCYREVLIEVNTPNTGRTLYGDVKPGNIASIIEEHLINDKPVDELIVGSSRKDTMEDSFFAKQKRIALTMIGEIDPESLEDYFNIQGYEATRLALTKKTPEEVIGIVNQSGIRGRGGAGFPTGKKWEFARNATGDLKYIICNADEGDPGAFMDRSVLEGCPHSVIEGMIIAGYAVGASHGVIYIRAEYPLAIKRLIKALDQAREKNLLGQNIFNSKFNFDISIKEGAGAFVCGEETALIASVEGQRGMPRSKPPYPAISGLWGKPTVINNVETLANIPRIILYGGDKYSEHGTEKSKGTKVFALTGKIKRSGLIEVPMGITLREVIFDIGGGIEGDKEFKAVQIGGPSGGCLPAALLDTSIDYESLSATGAIMGSGGMVVIDETSCIVDVAKYFLNFTQNESCGKCTTCRLGTKEMLAMLTRITEGEGQIEDLDTLQELGRKVGAISLCALGGTAPNPVLTTLKYFKEEYEAHILDKKCPAGVCKALIVYWIDPEICNGCTACLRVCPQDAIRGAKKELHIIDQELCSKCGMCYQRCRFDAVKVK